MPTQNPPSLQVKLTSTSSAEVPTVTGPRALTVRNFCTRYGVGRSKTYEEIKAGRLVAVKVGRRTLIRECDAERWMQALPTIPAISQPLPIPTAKFDGDAIAANPPPAESSCSRLDSLGCERTDGHHFSIEASGIANRQSSVRMPPRKISTIHPLKKSVRKRSASANVK
jgi:excisionase family DNA binding protein